MLQMPYTFAGIALPSSYWVPTIVTLDLQHRRANFTMSCFAVQSQYTETAEPIDARSYQINQDQFYTYFSDAALATKGPIVQCCQAASDTKDSLDSSGSPVSFFAGATIV